ncbi:hypothetical protein CHARACLAT_024975 [Characodon lateralis]|uniref:Uncharacterized protein n=1 Tax=Characodon lateralis TaxID=208331 RepID=A0ABU7F6W5_9TELE|nr:hypothetical protein [Characodon lateralis]
MFGCIWHKSLSFIIENKRQRRRNPRQAPTLGLAVVGGSGMSFDSPLGKTVTSVEPSPSQEMMEDTVNIPTNCRNHTIFPNSLAIILSANYVTQGPAVASGK